MHLLPKTENLTTGLKLSRQDTIATWSVIYSYIQNLTSKFKRGLGFCSLCCPLCFDYYVNKLTINKYNVFNNTLQ